MKCCNYCKLEKNENEFRLKKDKNGKYYRYYICIECEKEYNKIRNKKYKEEHKKEIKEMQHNWYLKKREKLLKDRKIYRLKNKDKITQYWNNNKERKALKNKRYREKHKEELNIKRNLKMKKDQIFRFKHTIRNMIRMSFKRKGKQKYKKVEEILGCTIVELINYLEETFKINYGYEWNKIEPVHIDHIIPLATANTEEEIIKLCHYTNLQLLKAKDNLSKGDKI